MKLRYNTALCAAQWLGTKEGSREHRMILEVYNRIDPLPRGYVVKQTDAWCAAFVSAVAVMAGSQKRYPLECSCTRMIDQARSMGIWEENDDYVPRIGDLVLYNWQANSTGNDEGCPDHVGIVIGLESGQILAVEGNYDNAVKLRRFPVNWEKIRGFICPKEEDEMRYHTLADIPAYARETIEKLVKDGSLRGISGDDLGLTEDLVRTLVILDRRGVL